MRLELTTPRSQEPRAPSTERARRPYPLNKLLSTQHSIVDYRHDVVLPISRTYSSCIIKTLYPLNSNFSLPPAPGNHCPAVSRSLTLYISYVSGIRHYLSFGGGQHSVQQYFTFHPEKGLYDFAKVSSMTTISPEGTGLTTFFISYP